MSKTGWNLPDGCSVSDVDRAHGGDVPDLPTWARCVECHSDQHLEWQGMDGAIAQWSCQRPVTLDDGTVTSCARDCGGGFTVSYEYDR